MLDIITLKTVLLTLQMACSPETAAITSVTDMGKVYACPRCRRAKPPGTLKRPHPGFNKDKNEGSN
ncbi:MAG: hypothetical protein JSR46_02030 [Verrucomicrobia bacterium]|nr:hypothetical protein [Verrucomicrobiota bacterium]